MVIGTGAPDDEAPSLIGEQRFTIICVAEVANDPMGEGAIAGGPAADLLKSAGRGAPELSARARIAVQDLVGSDGQKIMVTSTSMGGVSALGRGLHIGIDEFDVTAICTSDLHYAAPQEITRSGNNFVWEGPHCSDRFDFLEYTLVLNVSNIPADSTDGTVIYTGTPAAHSIGGPPTVGNFYAAFAHYNARGGSSAEGVSDGAVVGSYLQI